MKTAFFRKKTVSLRIYLTFNNKKIILKKNNNIPQKKRIYLTLSKTGKKITYLELI